MRKWLLIASLTTLAACEIVRNNSNPTDSRGVDARTVASDDCYPLSPSLAAAQERSENGALGRRPKLHCPEPGEEKRPAATAEGRKARPDFTRFERGPRHAGLSFGMTDFPADQSAAASGVGGAPGAEGSQSPPPAAGSEGAPAEGAPR